MVQLMTKEEAEALFESCDHTPNHKYEPEGTFVVFHDCDSWDAIDNSTGDAWTENCTSLEAAIKWLNREEDEEEEEDDEEVDTLEHQGDSLAGRLAGVALKVPLVSGSTAEEPTALANSDKAEKGDDAVALINLFNCSLADDKLPAHFTAQLQEYYEAETHQACQYWREKGSRDWETKLPRGAHFEIGPWTESFWHWLEKQQDEAIDAGAETLEDMMEDISLAWANGCSKSESLETGSTIPEPEDNGPHKLTLGELLPLVQGPVKIMAMYPGPLTWSAIFDDQTAAVQALAKFQEGRMLGCEVESVIPESAEADITNGSLCLNGYAKTRICIIGH